MLIQFILAFFVAGITTALLTKALRSSGPKINLLRIEGKLDALLKNAGIIYTPQANMAEPVKQALREGKIEGIKAYRQISGASLKEAKDYVEQFLDIGSRIEGKLDALLKGAGVTYDNNAGVAGAMQQALEQGGKIEAIRFYRERTGTGLKEAKDRVEAYLADPDHNPLT